MIEYDPFFDYEDLTVVVAITPLSRLCALLSVVVNYGVGEKRDVWQQGAQTVAREAPNTLDQFVFMTNSHHDTQMVQPFRGVRGLFAHAKNL